MGWHHINVSPKGSLCRPQQAVLERLKGSHVSGGAHPRGETCCRTGRGPGGPFCAVGSRGFAPGWSRKRFRGDGGEVWLGVPLGLQEPLLPGVTGYRYSQVIKSIN